MNFNIIKNMLKETFRGIARHPMIVFASVTTVSLMLIVLGAFLAFSINANFIMEKVGTEPPVEIWMVEDVEPAHLKMLETELDENILVKEHKVISPDEHYEIFKERLGKNAGTIESLDPTKLPYSFTVQLVGPSAIEEFKEKIQTFPGISEVQYSQSVLTFIESSSRVVNIVSTISIAVLLLVSLLIISNMVRISILARSEEIAIMKYVGATNSYIRIPYLLEGAFTGIIGSLIAGASIIFIYDKVYKWLMADTSMGDALALIETKNLVLPILAIVLIIGTLVGALGSGISVKKHVNV